MPRKCILQQILSEGSTAQNAQKSAQNREKSPKIAKITKVVQEGKVVIFHKNGSRGSGNGFHKKIKKILKVNFPQRIHPRGLESV